MKVSTLLTAMALLVCAAGAPSQGNLNIIFDEIENLNQSSTQNYFVEDLSALAEGRNKCRDPFFCKVRNIVLHKNFSKLAVEEKKVKSVERIGRELNSYFENRRVNCTKVLKKVATSTTFIEVSQFWNGVLSCIRTRMFSGK